VAVVQNTFTHRATQLIWEECWPCPVFASYTLAFALQPREKHGKTSVRVAEWWQLGTILHNFTLQILVYGMAEQDINNEKHEHETKSVPPYFHSEEQKVLHFTRFWRTPSWKSDGRGRFFYRHYHITWHITVYFV